MAECIPLVVIDQELKVQSFMVRVLEDDPATLRINFLGIGPMELPRPQVLDLVTSDGKQAGLLWASGEAALPLGLAQILRHQEQVASRVEFGG